MIIRFAACAIATGTLASTFTAFGATDAELLAASSPVLAANSLHDREFFPAARAVVTIDEKPIDFRGKFIFQIGGRLMVPLRPIGEALGARVSYNASTNTATASRAGYKLILGEGIFTTNGSTLVPLRTLSESLGVSLSVVNKAGFTRIALSSSHGGHTGVQAGVTVTSGSPRPATPVQTQKEDDISTSIEYNLKQLNALRARAGASPLKLDDRLNSFAREGSLELMRTHAPHGHFKSADVWQNGFENAAAENQGDPHGWFPGPTKESIDQILKAMMDEGPGGGHHDNILNKAYRRVGIGLVKDGEGRLYFTNDFSG